MLIRSIVAVVILLLAWVVFAIPSRTGPNDGPVPEQPLYPSGEKHLASGFLVCNTVDALRRGTDIQASGDMVALRRFLERSDECSASVAGQAVVADYESYGISKIRAAGSPDFRFVINEALQ